MTTIDLTKPIAGLIFMASLGIIAFAYPDWKDAPLLIIGAIIPLYIPLLYQIDHYRNRLARAAKLLDIFESYEHSGNDAQTLGKLDTVAREYVHQAQDGLSIQYRPQLQKPIHITPELIEGLKDVESAALVLLLDMYWKLFEYSDRLSRKDFSLLANRAANIVQYQKILLMRSLRGLGVTQPRLAALADRILNNHRGFIGVRLPEDSAEKSLRQKLASTTNESVWYMSTTSQVSGASRKSFLENSQNIDAVQLLIVSPLICTDGSLSSLDVEYDVPLFTVPRDQFLFQDLKGDRLRRIIKILSACKNVLDSTKALQLKYEISFYRFNYPDIKIVLLEKSGYAQVKVGGLRFANNLYRFGYEITDSEVFGEIKDMLKAFKTQSTRPFEPTSDAFFELCNQAIQEYYAWGQRNEIDQPRYEKIASLLRPSVDATEHLLLDKLTWLHDLAARTLASANLFYDSDIGPDYDDPTFRYIGPCKSATGETYLQVGQDGERFHVSVGVIFFDQGRILLTKKANPYYQGKWSIVGGHVNTGESPAQAISREIEEETGLRGLSLRLLFHSRNIHESCRHGIGHHRWYVFQSSDRLDLSSAQLNSLEISEATWCDPNAITSIPLTDACSAILKQVGLLPSSCHDRSCH